MVGGGAAILVSLMERKHGIEDHGKRGEMGYEKGKRRQKDFPLESSIKAFSRSRALVKVGILYDLP